MGVVHSTPCTRPRALLHPLLFPRPSGFPAAAVGQPNLSATDGVPGGCRQVGGSSLSISRLHPGPPCGLTEMSSRKTPSTCQVNSKCTAHISFSPLRAQNEAGRAGVFLVTYLALHDQESTTLQNTTRSQNTSPSSKKSSKPRDRQDRVCDTDIAHFTRGKLLKSLFRHRLRIFVLINFENLVSTPRANENKQL